MISSYLQSADNILKFDRRRFQTSGVNGGATLQCQHEPGVASTPVFHHRSECLTPSLEWNPEPAFESWNTVSKLSHLEAQLTTFSSSSTADVNVLKSGQTVSVGSFPSPDSRFLRSALAVIKLPPFLHLKRRIMSVFQNHFGS